MNTEAVAPPELSDPDDKEELATASEQELAIIEIFAARLNALLDVHEYSPKPKNRHDSLGKTLGVSLSAARKWCMGTGMPSPGVLVKIARHFQTSVDYLLGLQDAYAGPTCGLHRSTAIPIYSFGENNLARTKDTAIPPPKHRVGSTGMFQQMNRICFERDDDEPENNQRFFVESWMDMRNPTLHKGDLLLIDPTETHLLENGTYLIATKAMICVRRIIAQIDGRAELIGEYADKQESSFVKVEDIVYNVSRKPDEPLPTKGIKILGRVIAKIIKLDTRIRGLM